MARLAGRGEGRVAAAAEEEAGRRAGEPHRTLLELSANDVAPEDVGADGLRGLPPGPSRMSRIAGAPSGAVGRVRLERVKAVPFFEAARSVAAEVGRALPERPGKILCMIHEERRPSFHLYEDHWWCYGCGRGGRAIELAAAVWELDPRRDLGAVLDRLAPLLGVAEDDLASAAALVRRAPPDPASAPAWIALLDALERELLDRARPYLLADDPIARDLAEGPCWWALREVDDARADVPLTDRGRRERVRRLRRWALDLLEEVEERVAHATGRDRLDVAARLRVDPLEGRRRAAARTLLAILGRLRRRKSST